MQTLSYSTEMISEIQNFINLGKCTETMILNIFENSIKNQLLEKKATKSETEKVYNSNLYKNMKADFLSNFKF